MLNKVKYFSKQLFLLENNRKEIKNENKEVTTKPLQGKDLLPNINIPNDLQLQMKQNEILFYQKLEKFKKEFKNINLFYFSVFTIFSLLFLIYYLKKEPKEFFNELDDLELYLKKLKEHMELNNLNEKRVMFYLENIFKFLKLNNRDSIEQFKKLNSFKDFIYLLNNTDDIYREVLLKILHGCLCYDLQNNLQNFNHEQLNESLLKIFKDYKFDNPIDGSFSILSRMLILSGVCEKLTIEDVETTLQKMEEKNNRIDTLQKEFDEKLSDIILQIERGLNISNEENNKMVEIERQLNNPYRNQEEFYLNSLLISCNFVKLNEHLLKYIRLQFKGNNHLSVIPSIYLLLKYDEISKHDVFRNRLLTNDKEKEMDLCLKRISLVQNIFDSISLDTHEFKNVFIKSKELYKGTYLEYFNEYLFNSQFGHVSESELLQQELLLYKALNLESRDVQVLFELATVLLKREDMTRATQIIQQIQNIYPFFAPIKAILMRYCKSDQAIKVLMQNPFVANQLLSFDKWDVCYKLRLKLQQQQIEK
ncbi:hypothetical protein ABK040_001620 [Willaertia magna]